MNRILIFAAAAVPLLAAQRPLGRSLRVPREPPPLVFQVRASARHLLQQPQLPQPRHQRPTQVQLAALVPSPQGGSQHHASGPLIRLR
jgi:hypothetical protein